MTSPWEESNGTETRIISSFIDCGIGFPLERVEGNYYLLTFLTFCTFSLISPWLVLKGALEMV